MRILLLADSYLPNATSCAHQIRDLAAALAGRGVEVVVAAPSDDLSAKAEITQDSGVTVARVRTYDFKNASLPRRAWAERLLPSVMWSRLNDFFRQNTCQMICAYAPSIFWAPLILRLKKLWRSPAYLILRDIFPQWSVDVGLLRPDGAAHAYLRRVEARLYRAVDVVGVQSPANLTHFQNLSYQPAAKLEVLYNWGSTLYAETDSASLTPTPPDLGKVVLVSGGSLGIAQDGGNLLRLAAGLAETPGLQFLMIGEGRQTERLKNTATSLGLQNVRWQPSLEQVAYHRLLSQCHIGLISLDRRLGVHNFPGRLFSYFAAGLPVLASLNPGNDLAQLLTDSGAGLVVTNGQDQELAEAAKALCNDPDMRRSMGAMGRRLLETRFSVETAADQIMQHLEQAPVSRQSV